ncbi:HD domain-containing protein [Burkholderia anthina]|uniref:HD domain-containing protein n=1 Tax=Burkholderia anthina TaxID=179879 RepID=UPI00384FB926
MALRVARDRPHGGHARSGRLARSRRAAERRILDWRQCVARRADPRQHLFADTLKLLKLSIVHDLGEALRGDLLTLTAGLDRAPCDEIVALWDECEAAASPEARAAKALDKPETILQHNQGSNPPDFDYAFNLGYGRRYTDAAPLFAALRTIVDGDTQRRIDARSGNA